MKSAIIYIHGKGGTAEESEHYKPFFKNADVIGFDYKAQTPWEAKEEFPLFFDSVNAQYETVSIIANSIGASLTVMESGEHWFHTDAQMKFLDGWICSQT